MVVTGGDLVAALGVLNPSPMAGLGELSSSTVMFVKGNVWSGMSNSLSLS